MISRFILLFAVGLVLSGCVSAPPGVKLLVAGGQRITVEMGRGKVIVLGETPQVLVHAGGLVVSDQKKQAIYAFLLEFKVGDVPQSIKIEEVSEDTAQLIVEDRAPKFTKERFWDWKSEPLPLDARILNWVHEIDDSFRILRLTVQLADGRKLVQHQVTYYPAFLKWHLRNALGLETPASP